MHVCSSSMLCPLPFISTDISIYLLKDSTFSNGLSTPASLLSQSEKTGRRSHKMMTVAGRPRKEPVWPPVLEEALLEGMFSLSFYALFGVVERVLYV